MRFCCPRFPLQTEKGIKYRHTWNIVRINGQYYHLDATFDNTLGKNEDDSVSIRYDYFNLDDKNIFRDHEPLLPHPARMEAISTTVRKSSPSPNRKTSTSVLSRPQERPGIKKPSSPSTGPRLCWDFILQISRPKIKCLLRKWMKERNCKAKKTFHKFKIYRKSS